MKCPFLQEARVKYCQASPFKKMIVDASEPSSPERCSSPAFVECPSAPHEDADTAGAQHCPNLQISLMQYCSAASVTKYIPYSESLLSRCGTENHRYCELYLAIAEPDDCQTQPDPAADDNQGAGEEHCFEGVQISGRVSYSPNHMWLDVDEDGACHVGVDAFFTHVLGKIEKLSFITPRGTGRPCAVISTRGVDLPMIFPLPITVTRTNDYLRANPDKVTAHPYSLGWLFEGKLMADQGTGNAALLHGKAALDWMRAEVERMSHFIHERCLVGESAGEPLMMDGGAMRPGLAQHLGQEEILTVFNEFFSF